MGAAVQRAGFTRQVGRPKLFHAPASIAWGNVPNGGEIEALRNV